MLNAIALLGHGAQGFVQGQASAADLQAKQQALAEAKANAAWQASERQRVLNTRAAMQTAAAPVAPTPDMIQGTDGTQVQNTVPDPTTDSIDVGQPGTAPAIPTSVVAGQTGLTPAQVPAAVAAQQTPDNMMQRQIVAMQGIDPVQAAAMQQSLTSTQSAKMDLAARQFDQGLTAAAGQGWDALGKFMDDSGSNTGKGQWVPSADGTTMTANRVNPDGTMTPTGLTFPNTTQGRMDAAATLSRSMPIQAKLQHFVAEQQANTQEGYRRDQKGYMDENAAARHELAAARQTSGDASMLRAQGGGAGGRNSYERMSEADKGQLTDLNKQLELINTERTKAQAGGMWQDGTPGANAIKMQEATLMLTRSALLQKYQGNAPADPLNLRGSGGTTTVTTRPASKLQMIQADMKKSGITNANANVDGQKITFGDVNTPAPIVPASAPKVQAGPMVSATSSSTAQIPDPPPQFRQVGLTSQPNPLFADWQSRFGTAYAAQQQAQQAANAKAALAARSYNPYMQNAVK